MLASQELENNASRLAEEAIRLDSQGSRGMAIQNYQGAVGSLLKLVHLSVASCVGNALPLFQFRGCS